MRRREFLGVLGGAAGWPIASHAQHAMPLIGFVSSRSPSESASVVAAFRKGLGETGFVEGQNVAIAFRWAEGRYERLAELATELVALRVAVIFAAGGPPSALAAKAATTTIPVVFSAANDPVRLGLVASLNRPGGNVTGMGTLVTELAAKSVAILKQMVPTAAVVGYLANPTNPASENSAKEAQAAAGPLDVELHVLRATTVAGLSEVFAAAAKQRVGALVVNGDPFFDSQREMIVGLSAQHGIAGCYPWREYVLAGGLMSYGTNLPNSYRQAGVYTGRVLKGEKPADLPVMQPTKFELVLNLKTAKVLGLQTPQNLLATADEVIE
jgi:putative tryptophan/tyrosine transport system substrate-binding protein